nr:coagulation factor IIIb [Misgurnus anguillicaudatus]
MESRITMLCALFLACLALVNGSPASVPVHALTKATDVSWTSYNFKTILTWGPKPVNYTYTVEYYNKSGIIKQRKLHCIRSTETECDLTNELGKHLNEDFTAEVLSEPLPGMNANHEELPFTRSKIFCPYNDTLIGRPDFKLMMSADNKLMLIIHDPVTALVKNNTHLNIRDIFKKNLKYKITYNKAGSTGKKIETVNENKVDLSKLKLDEDQSYCFSVAAYIPSRKGNKRFGEWSLPKCSSQENKSIFEEYGLAVLGGAAVIILLLVIALIVLIVLCCKRLQRPAAKETITV